MRITSNNAVLREYSWGQNDRNKCWQCENKIIMIIISKEIRPVSLSPGACVLWLPALHRGRGRVALAREAVTEKGRLWWRRRARGTCLFFPTRSGSQRRREFTSDIRKEEAGGLREATLFITVVSWPLHHRVGEPCTWVPHPWEGAHCGSQPQGPVRRKRRLCWGSTAAAAWLCGPRSLRGMSTPRQLIQAGVLLQGQTLYY